MAEQLDQERRVSDEQLVLHVGEESVTGWSELDVGRALDQAAGTFSIELPASRLPAPRGSRVELAIGDDVVLRGFVELRRVRDDGASTMLTLAGRDVTGDLVDCSPKTEPAEWRNIELRELIETLIAPFALELEVAPGVQQGARFAKFAVQPGETVWAAIERACRLRGVLCYPTPLGRLLLATPAAGRAAGDLVQAVNVMQLVAEENDADRFDIYYVRGQSFATSQSWGANAAAIEGTARDEGIKRYRPLILLADGPVTFESAQDRASWEAQRRAALADRITVRAHGWRSTPAGPLWTVNELVGVRYPRLEIDADRLINAVHFRRSNAGTWTDLELVRPDAYNAEPIVEERDSDWRTHDVRDESLEDE